MLLNRLERLHPHIKERMAQNSQSNCRLKISEFTFQFAKLLKIRMPQKKYFLHRICHRVQKQKQNRVNNSSDHKRNRNQINDNGTFFPNGQTQRMGRIFVIFKKKGKTILRKQHHSRKLFNIYERKIRIHIKKIEKTTFR